MCVPRVKLSSVVEIVNSIVSFSVIVFWSILSLNLLYSVSPVAAALIPIVISFSVLRSILTFLASIVSTVPCVVASSYVAITLSLAKSSYPSIEYEIMKVWS